MFETRSIHSDEGEYEISVLIKEGRTMMPSLNIEGQIYDNPLWLRAVLFPALENYLLTGDKTHINVLWGEENNIPQEPEKLIKIYEIVSFARHLGWLHD